MKSIALIIIGNNIYIYISMSILCFCIKLFRKIFSITMLLQCCCTYTYLLCVKFKENILFDIFTVEIEWYKKCKNKISWRHAVFFGKVNTNTRHISFSESKMQVQLFNVLLVLCEKKND